VKRDEGGWGNPERRGCLVLPRGVLRVLPGGVGGTAVNCLRIFACLYCNFGTLAFSSFSLAYAPLHTKALAPKPQPNGAPHGRGWAAGAAGGTAQTRGAAGAPSCPRERFAMPCGPGQAPRWRCASSSVGAETTWRRAAARMLIPPASSPYNCARVHAWLRSTHRGGGCRSHGGCRNHGPQLPAAHTSCAHFARTPLPASELGRMRMKAMLQLARRSRLSAKS